MPNRKKTPIEALHTFARGYCLEREAQLRQECTRAKAQNCFRAEEHGYQRRAVVETILVEVERLTPQDFRSRQRAFLRLIETGQTAQSRSLQQKMWQQPPYLQAMQEERTCFVVALRQFAAQKDWKRWCAEPLPYQRTLLADESDSLMARLRQQWGITKRSWVPFDHYELPYVVLVLDSSAVRDLMTIDVVRAILAQHGIERLYQLWEHGEGPDREIDLAAWNPYQIWSEIYWLTDQMDWLFYKTHENSTTIAGDWLLEEIKAVWPTWSAHMWKAPWTKAEATDAS